MINLLATQRIVLDAHGQPADSLEAAYTVYFNSLGVNLYPVSNHVADLDAYLEGVRYDGLLLTGGGDVGPELAGPGGCTVTSCFPERDRTCVRLVDKMISGGRPVMGICYGMQLLNCYFGGGLTADVHRGAKDRRRPGTGHEAGILMPVYGISGVCTVSQYHDNGVRLDEVAPCFDVFARDAEYDVAEGIIHKDLPIIGIQWHPERDPSDRGFNERLIKGFFGI